MPPKSKTETRRAKLVVEEPPVPADASPVTIEDEVWAHAFPVKPRPSDSPLEAALAPESTRLYTSQGLVTVEQGDYLIRMVGADSMDFIVVPAEHFDDSFTREG
jgi:hypothetical protein